jgi:hypothetical protein
MCVAFIGCATDPLMSGKAEDWVGHLGTDLKTSWGEPTNVIRKSDGTEIWEYLQSGDFRSPEQENTSFRLGGLSGGNAFSAGGGINTTKNKEHIGTYQKIFRFSIKAGKIKSWYAARVEDGRVVWEDH